MHREPSSTRYEVILNFQWGWVPLEMLLVIYVSPSTGNPHGPLTIAILAATANIQYANHDIKVTLLHNPSHLGTHCAVHRHPLANSPFRGHQSCSDGDYSGEAVLDATWITPKLYDR